MAAPIAVFACSHRSARVGCRPCDVSYPRTSFLDLSSVGSITSTPLGAPETDHRGTARERRGTRFACPRRCSARSRTRSRRTSAQEWRCPTLPAINPGSCFGRARSSIGIIAADRSPELLLPGSSLKLFAISPGQTRSSFGTGRASPSPQGPRSTYARSSPICPGASPRSTVSPCPRLP